MAVSAVLPKKPGRIRVNATPPDSKEPPMSAKTSALSPSEEIRE
jgi:hypothetical protein